MAKSKPRKKFSKKQNDSNYKALYDPVFPKLYGKGEELGNDVETTIWDKLQDPKEGEDRSIPPIDPVLKEMQGRINSMTDSELKGLINSKSIGDIIKNKPSNTSVFDLYKYQKHIKGLIDEGYTFKDGGILPDMKKNKKDTKKSYERLIKAGLVDGGKLKGKLALGGDQSNDLQMQTARAIPVWGKLAQFNVQGGRAIRGDGTNTAANIAGGFADEPSRVFNAIKSGNLVEAVPIVGDIATTKRKRKELDNTNNLQQTGIKSSLIQNSGGLAKGGKLNSIPNKLKVIQGGSLNPISKDAVEVNANNPSQTDSVELQDAFVDNNEVIDKKNRVFSDEILGSSGKSIAKEAKRLEKMKSTSSRFKDSNDRIESQLDSLFNQQEQMKQDKTRVANRPRNINPIDSLQEETIADKKLSTAIPKLGAKQSSFSERMAKLGYDSGGELGVDPKFKTQEEHNAYYTNILVNKMKSDNPSLYTKYQESTASNNQADVQTSLMAAGGLPRFTPDKTPFKPANPTQWDKLGFNNDTTPEGFRYSKNKPDKDSITNKLTFKKGGKMKLAKGDLIPSDGTQVTSTQYDGNPFLASSDKTPNSFNWSGAVNSAATVAPNITNAFLQKRLKGPKAPQLETDIRLQRIDPAAQLAETQRQGSLANSLITKNTSQGANLSSSLGSVLAKRLSANNQIYGQNQQINAQIQGNEAQINQASRARNAERINQFRGNQVDFANKKVQLTSENVANLSAKIQSNTKERNLMNLDKDKFNIIQSRFEDLPAELKAKYPTVFDYYNSPEYKKHSAFGGYISRKSNKRNRSTSGK